MQRVSACSGEWGQAWVWSSPCLSPSVALSAQKPVFSQEERMAAGCLLPWPQVSGDFLLPWMVPSVSRGDIHTRNMVPGREGCPLAMWEMRGGSPWASGSSCIYKHEERHGLYQHTFPCQRPLLPSEGWQHLWDLRTWHLHTILLKEIFKFW